MNKLIIVLIFFTTTIFAQKIEIGDSENQLKTYKFVYDNFEKIKQNNPEEIIYVTLSFNKNHFIEKINYFSCTKENMFNEKKAETKVSSELNEFIENSFSFSSNNIFFTKSLGETSYSFYIPLSKKELEKLIKGNQKTEPERDKIEIPLNSKFDLQISNLYFDKIKYNDKNIGSKLNILNSELIEIAPNLYLIFRIIKTNQFKTNIADDYFEYKIMYLKGTSSELYTDCRKSFFYSNKIELNEMNSIGGNDNLADSKFCETTDEITELSRKFEDFKFNLKIQFVK